MKKHGHSPGRLLSRQIIKKILPEKVYEEIRDLRLFGTRAFSGKNRVLPDFLIIGAARSGTTSLYSYLDFHPNFKSAFTKEIHFFDKRSHRGLGWYRIHFPLISESKHIFDSTGFPLITGDATPTYLFDPTVPLKVARDLPKVKLIVLLRNPVERAFSSHSLMVKLGVEGLSFEDALNRENYISGEPEHIAFYYKKRGIYVEQLERWFRCFPRESFLIFRSEDFFLNTASVFNEVCNFLGLPTVETDKFPQLNSATKSKINPFTRERLQEYYQPYNKELELLLGKNFKWE